MALMRWSVSNRENRGRNLRVRVTLHDVNGVPIPPPAGARDEITAPPTGEMQVESVPPGSWPGLRCHIGVSPHPMPGPLAPAYAVPLPAYPPIPPPPPSADVEEVTVILEPATVEGAVLATVRMRDAAGNWRPLCVRQSVPL
jgi:hypothetical protein